MAAAEGVGLNAVVNTGDRFGLTLAFEGEAHSAAQYAAYVERLAAGERAWFGALNRNEQLSLLRTSAQEGIEMAGNPASSGSPDAWWLMSKYTRAEVDFVGTADAYKNWTRFLPQYNMTSGQRFLNQIADHINENHFLAIDLTGSSELQQYEILSRVYALPARQRGGIVLTGW